MEISIHISIATARAIDKLNLTLMERWLKYIDQTLDKKGKR